jgi:signal transduction histidine kinase
MMTSRKDWRDWQLTPDRVERTASEMACKETMRELREGLVKLSEDIHALSYRLHPSTLTDLGLAEALKANANGFRGRVRFKQI